MLCYGPRVHPDPTDRICTHERSQAPSSRRPVGLRRPADERLRVLLWRLRGNHSVQRPARTDDCRAGGDLREADRDQGGGALRRRGDARQSDPAGGIELAGGRLLHGEHPGARRARREGAARERRAGDPGRDPRPLQLRRRATGSAFPPAPRCSSTTPARSRPRNCRARSSNWPSRSGKARSASRLRRPTSSR